MSLKKKLTMAVLTTTLGATIVAAGSFALFTSSANNTGNTFAAGSVHITDATGGAIFSASKIVSNLAPGDGETAQLKVTNDGELDAWVALDGYTLDPVDQALFAGDQPTTITLDKKVVHLASGETASFDVSYKMPLEADNDYQNATGKFDVKVKAVQYRNNIAKDATTGAEVGPLSWNENAQ